MTAFFAVVLLGLALFAIGMFGLGWVCRGLKRGDDLRRDFSNADEGEGV